MKILHWNITLITSFQGPFYTLTFYTHRGKRLTIFILEPAPAHSLFPSPHSTSIPFIVSKKQKKMSRKKKFHVFYVIPFVGGNVQLTNCFWQICIIDKSVRFPLSYSKFVIEIAQVIAKVEWRQFNASLTLVKIVRIVRLKGV